ncbi:MAG: L,D-transpeptidase family protein [Rhodospirillales bacterium]|nr:L,D-transpeptidase family protein [Rhodospirillales bacterium]
MPIVRRIGSAFIGALFALAVIGAAPSATLGAAPEATPGATPEATAAKTGDIIGEMHDYVTWNPKEDMLDIARAEELGLIELMVANPGVDPWFPGPNTHVTLPTMHILPDARHVGIVINTAELRLYYYGAEDGPLSFPLGVGRDGYLTPVGSTKIVRKKDHPSWYLTASEIRDHPELPRVVPPGEDNPLGEYAMYLGWPSYLIHGTNTPWGIGRRTSRGCIRMYPEDIEWLFERVPIGTPVTVVDQVVKLGWKDGELYIEVQPSTKQIDTMEETSKSPPPPEPLPLAQEADHILAVAGEDVPRLDWPAIEKALNERVGYPIRITLAPGPNEQANATNHP